MGKVGTVVEKTGLGKKALDLVNPFKNKLKKYIVATAGYNSFPEMKRAYQEGELSLNDIAKIGVKAAAGPIVTTYKGGKAVLDEAIKEIYSQFGQKKAMGGMMEARKKGMGLKMNTGGMAGFPDLTGDGKVTQKDILRGRKVPGFKGGGTVKKRVVKRKPKSRGTGAAVRGTKFKGIF